VYVADPGFWGQDFFRYTATDPTGESLPGTVYIQIASARFIVFNIYYYWTTLSMTPGIKSEVTRIIKDLFDTHGAKKAGQPCWNPRVNFIPKTTKAEYDLLKYVNKTPHFGIEKNTFGTIVTLGVEDSYRGPGEGSGANYEGNIKGSVLNSDIKIAAAVAHEVVWHGVGYPGVHYHDFGYTDAKLGNSWGKVFSPEAKSVLARKLGITRGC
jgi:hypothetical protein